MNTSKFTPGVIVILAAAAVMLIFSFFPFYESDGPGVGGQVEDRLEECRENAEAAGLDPDDLCPDVEVQGRDEDPSAWSKSLRWVAVLPVLYGLLMAALVALTSFANVKLPARVIGLTWPQIYIALGLNAAVLMIAAFLRDRGPYDFGFAFWLMLLAGLGLAVGAILYQREAVRGPATPPPPPPPAPPPA